MGKISFTIKSALCSFSLAAAAPLMAQTVETVITPDGEEMDIVSMGQLEAAKMYKDSMRDIQNDPTIKFVLPDQLMRALSRRVAAKVIANLPEEMESDQKTFIGMIFSERVFGPDRFDPYNLRPIDGLATMKPEKVKKYLELEAGRKLCILGRSDADFSANEWVDDFLDAKIDKTRSEDVFEAFAPMFERMANLHERSHCYNDNDEFDADYITASEMLRTAENVEETKEFFKLWAAIRLFGTILRSHDVLERMLTPQYFKVEGAVNKALTDYDNGIRYADYDSIVTAATKIDWSKDWSSKEQLDDGIRRIKNLYKPKPGI